MYIHDGKNCMYICIYIYTLPLRDGILHVEESDDSCCVMCRMHYLHSNFGSFPEDASKRKELRSPCLQLMAFKRRLAILISMECMCACMQVQQISFEQIWTRGRHATTVMSVLISCTLLVHQDSCWSGERWSASLAGSTLGRDVRFDPVEVQPCMFLHCAMHPYLLLNVHARCRGRANRDDDAYRVLVRHDLAVKNAIQYVQLPMTNAASGEVELVDWPMMLPHHLVTALWNTEFVHIYDMLCDL